MRRFLTGLLIFGMLALPVRAADSKKYVALTFDDGPSGKYTRALLDGLYDRGAKATFLLCGYRIKDYPGVRLTRTHYVLRTVKNIHSSGFESEPSRR